MAINSKYIVPKFKKNFNPKIGLITLSSDYIMESDFISVCKDLPLNIFVNRIKNYNPLTKENLLKMYDQIESVTKNILPNDKYILWFKIFCSAHKKTSEMKELAPNIKQLLKILAPNSQKQKS